MARELRRLLIDPSRLRGLGEADGPLPLLPEEDHYLCRVLRLRSGEEVALIDGCGGLWRARRGDGPWLESLEQERLLPERATPCLTLALALPRQDVELVWRMATELGIDRIQPLQAERCQALGRRPPWERWSAVVREATEQCERLWLPLLEPLQEASQWLSQPHEGLTLLAMTRRSLPPLEQCLRAGETVQAPPREVTLAIGPEGGWSPREEEIAEAAGWRGVSLGEAILRSTTAAVCGVSRLAAWRQLSC